MPTPQLSPGECIGLQYLLDIPKSSLEGNATRFNLQRHLFMERLHAGESEVDLEHALEALLGAASRLHPFTVPQHVPFAPKRSWVIMADVLGMRRVLVPQLGRGCWPPSSSEIHNHLRCWRERPDGSVDFFEGHEQVWNAPALYWAQPRTER